LVTGASGAGKSTTLAALLEHINQNRACHIITLEDPIEFEYTNGRALIHQRELGRYMNSFSSGLTAALRESPDVILLGEMRDAATVAAALTAAETGHLVLSTLHTGDAASAIDRIIDVFPGHQQAQVRHQLASVLRVVLTQILVPAAVSFGRVPAIEKLKVTGGAACHIREGRSHQIAGVIQAGGGDGMITLERSLAGLVNNKMITLKTALTYARDEEGLRKLISGGL
jgi:twitching motility protein PilT